MRWSITLGSFKGTTVRIHVTFLLFLAWIGFSAYQRGGSGAAIESVLFIVSIFACVVLHEFGHILTARRFGIVSPEVTLLPIGGVADMSRMPDRPWQELLIAVAGPMVNIVIAAVLLLGLGALSAGALLHIDDPGIGMIERLAVANLFLAVFNMIPAFPMDGGRVLRAGLAMWLGQAKATSIAALIGQGFAFLLGFAGLFGNPMLIFIAFFVYFAAAGEAQMTVASQAMRGVAVGDAMETRIERIGRGATVGEAVEILLATSQDEFPIVDGRGRLTGLLSRASIVDALKEADPGAPIAPFAQPDPPTIFASEMLDTVLQRLGDAEAIGVLDAQGAFVGLITRQSIAEVMLIKTVRPEWRFARRAATAASL